MRKRPWIIAVILVCLLLTVPLYSYSHPGRTDAQGGHYDRKSGQYHYHPRDSSTSKPESSLSQQPSSIRESVTSKAKTQQSRDGLSKQAPTKGSISKARSVKRVIDGDTLVLENGEKVRLIGVDTPETKHPNKPVQRFGKEASAFTKRMVEGKKIRLKYDWQRKDKYGWTLAYVYTEDGVFLNAEIIKQGYGFAYTKYPFEHMDEFREYEGRAREGKRGLWGD